MAKKSLIAGALILTLANLITRFLGFFYRVYMVNTIGAEGMGLYQLIMPIYSLAWSITSSGFTTTISKLTAQENARKQYGNMGRILKQSVFMCMTISIFISIFLFFFADFVSVSILKESRVIISLKILSVCFPFMSAGSCIRGYFFGMQDSLIPAVSQVTEQSIRMIIVFMLSSFFIPLGLEYACAAAVLGIVGGEIISFLYVYFSYIKFKRKNKFNKKPTLSPTNTFLTITKMAIPLSASRVIGSFLVTLENILIPQRLRLFGQSESAAMIEYGKLTGMAMPLIQLPSALLMAVSITLVPAISEASAISNFDRIKYTIGRSISFTSIIGIGTACVFAVFPYEICSTIYNQPDLGEILLKLAFICPFIYLQITLSGILNGLGMHGFIFKNNIISSIINLLFIYFLMPVYGTNAFIIGWLISLIVTSYLSMSKILKATNIRPEINKWFVKPLLCIMASGLITRYLYHISEPSKFIVILCIFLMLLLYIVFLILVGCITKDELFSLLRVKK